MIVCSCGLVSDKQIRQAACQNLQKKFGKVAPTLNLCQNCGVCGKCAKALFTEAQARCRLVTLLQQRSTAPGAACANE